MDHNGFALYYKLSEFEGVQDIIKRKLRSQSLKYHDKIVREIKTRICDFCDDHCDHDGWSWTCEGSHYKNHMDGDYSIKRWREHALGSKRFTYRERNEAWRTNGPPRYEGYHQPKDENYYDY